MPKNNNPKLDFEWIKKEVAIRLPSTEEKDLCKKIFEYFQSKEGNVLKNNVSSMFEVDKREIDSLISQINDEIKGLEK